MELIEKIEYCKAQLTQIWKLIQDLQEDGISDKDPIFDHLEEKAWEWAWKLEVFSAMDPANRLKFNEGIRMN